MESSERVFAKICSTLDCTCEEGPSDTRTLLCPGLRCMLLLDGKDLEMLISETFLKCSTGGVCLFCCGYGIREPCGARISIFILQTLPLHGVKGICGWMRIAW